MAAEVQDVLKTVCPFRAAWIDLMCSSAATPQEGQNELADRSSFGGHRARHCQARAAHGANRGHSSRFRDRW